MIVCVQCRLEMDCHKNAVGADFGNGHVYHSDRWKCPACGIMVLVACLRPIFDPEYTAQDEYLEMAKKEVM